MTDQEAHDLLSHLFRALCDPAVSAEARGEYFAPGYVQAVDGKLLDRGDFLDHVRALKSVLASGSVTLEKVIASGSTIASNHVVNARKKTGESVQMKVLAFFEIKNGLVQRTDELTYLIRGAAADRDLGSRTSG